MKFGQKGKELLLDLKRSSQDYQSETHAIINIPPYNMDAVRSCIDESTYHYSELAALATATPSSQTDGSSDNVDGKAVKQQRMGFNLRPALLLHDACLRKNKRCLLAYHAYRADRVREIRWEGMGGGALGLPEHVLTNMLDVEVGTRFSKYFFSIYLNATILHFLKLVFMRFLIGNLKNTLLYNHKMAGRIFLEIR